MRLFRKKADSGLDPELERDLKEMARLMKVWGPYTYPRHLWPKPSWRERIKASLLRWWACDCLITV